MKKRLSNDQIDWLRNHMKSFARNYYYYVGIVILLFVATFFILNSSSKVERNDAKPLNPSLRDRVDSNRDRKISNRARASRVSVSSRHDQMERLKMRWLALGPGNDRLDDRDALAMETLEDLLCSEELIELSEYLKQNKISTGHSGNLDLLGTTVFGTPRASEARRVLIETAAKGVPWEVVQRWCVSAGKTCPNDEFEAFYAALAQNNTKAAAMAMLGRNSEFVKENPDEAISTTLEVLMEMPDEKYLLERQLESLPASTNFETIERILDEKDSKKVFYRGACEELFKVWGTLDPAGAANYVMDHPERLDPDLVSLIGARATADPKTTVEWIKTFPEGVYLDAAAAGAAGAFSLKHPDLAEEAAALIGDAEKRAAARQQIQGIRQSILNGDKL